MSQSAVWDTLQVARAIEARLGSYADLIQPVAYGVFAVPGDDDA